MGITHIDDDAGPPAADRARATLPPPPQCLPRPALFLDLDGVLAPIAPSPDDVGPDARRTRVLRDLAERLDGRVAIVSGRTVAEVDRIVDAAVIPASGVHGLERRRADGTSDHAGPSPQVRIAVQAFHAFARERPGILVEDKGVAAGLHYRGAPDQAEAAGRLARDLAVQTGLTLQPGKMVLELKTPGSDKGSAVRAFMSEPPFAGAMPVMLGDDLTDEFGFAACEAFGGFGVLVGPTRDTAARFGLADVEAVLTWLEAVQAR
jgi:trehalose 6-phosphate phosphatase